MSSSSSSLTENTGYTLQEIGNVPLDFLGYLQTQAANIRELQINWLPYLQEKAITREQCIFITLYQEAEDNEAKENIINFFGLRSFSSFLTILTNITTIEVLQKVTILVDDMLYEDIKKVNCFYRVREKKKGEPPFKPFLKLLESSDDFVRNVSSRIVSKLITYKEPRMFGDDLRTYTDWLKENLWEENEYIHSVLRCLQRVFKHQRYRSEVTAMSILHTMLRLVSNSFGQQTKYQISFCIWLSTYDDDLMEKLVEMGIVPIMGKVLIDCPPEYAKLQRIIMAILRNLIEKPQEEEDKKHNSLMMVQAGVVKYMNLLEMRTHLFKDEEFAEDYQFVCDALQNVIKDMTSFGEYQLELKSGKLNWSVVHTSQKFWKENAYKLNEKKYELVKRLIHFLETSTNPTILSVACYDLGQYMKNYTRGRKIVMKFGGKDYLIDLLSHNHPAVKFNALKALQILMLNNCHILERNARGSTQVTEINL